VSVAWQVIEAPVVNRLTSPLVRVEDWARCWAVEEVFGIEPGLPGDDRLARGLDTIAPHLERILVHSTANAAGRQAVRDERLAKAAADLNKLITATAGATTRSGRRSSP
jgi:hypothetical protein